VSSSRSPGARPRRQRCSSVVRTTQHMLPGLAHSVTHSLSRGSRDSRTHTLSHLVAKRRSIRMPGRHVYFISVSITISAFTARRYAGSCGRAVCLSVCPQATVTSRSSIKMVKRVMKLSQSGRATRYRSFSECDLFSQSCAAADKVSTDVERRAIPLTATAEIHSSNKRQSRRRNVAC